MTSSNSSDSSPPKRSYLHPGPIESFVANGLKTFDYYFDLPLNHTDQSSKQTIVVFARRVVAVERQDDAEKMPWLVFFQGGPGFQAPDYNTYGSIDDNAPFSAWVKMAAKKYNVLLLDQRGTGLSTPMTVQRLSQFKTPQEQADYFMYFRADSIVRDSELIRETLLASVTAAYITGGIPPVFDSLETVYRKTFKSAIEHTERYYKRFPMDIKRVKKIMKYLATNEVRLPTGGILTPRRFQQLGLSLGLSGGMDRIHSLCLQAFVTLSDGKEELSSLFLTEMESQEQTPPIYVILHEAIYNDGPGVASNWTASRLLKEEFKSTFEYSLEKDTSDKPVYFTGEHMFDWMLDDYASLQPLKECAEILAKCNTWPKLYDPEVLAKNTVPVAAAMYYDDMFVARECSEKTASRIQGLRLWITNEYMHSGLRDNEAILSKLFQIISGETDVPVS
ncbi:hypothetical protein BX616_010439 [Lobosporangium transversale]|nr:hypothetical protein BX616_010439 [Lobosporangium transversale]